MRGSSLLPECLDLLNLLGQKLGEALLQCLRRMLWSMDDVRVQVLAGRVATHLSLGGVASRRGESSVSGGDGGLEGSPQGGRAETHSRGHFCGIWWYGYEGGSEVVKSRTRGK